MSNQNDEQYFFSSALPEPAHGSLFYPKHIIMQATSIFKELRNNFSYFFYGEDVELSVWLIYEYYWFHPPSSPPSLRLIIISSFEKFSRILRFISLSIPCDFHWMKTQQIFIQFDSKKFYIQVVNNQTSQRTSLWRTEKSFFFIKPFRSVSRKEFSQFFSNQKQKHLTFKSKTKDKSRLCSNSDRFTVHTKHNVKALFVLSLNEICLHDVWSQVIVRYKQWLLDFWFPYIEFNGLAISEQIIINGNQRWNGETEEKTTIPK